VVVPRVRRDDEGGGEVEQGQGGHGAGHEHTRVVGTQDGGVR
jgi:hypothetical protein